MNLIKTMFTSIKMFDIICHELVKLRIIMNTTLSAMSAQEPTLMGNKNADLNLYQLILEEIEAPLFRAVMELTRYNQSKAARVLGVSRGTLRTKLKYYFDDEFIGTRED
jgi:Fis family transcriptional regulator, factor for inversion stimulation protein